MFKVLLTGSGYDESLLSKLHDNNFAVTHIQEHLGSQQIMDIISQFDAYILGGDERLTASELKFANKLKVISFVGTGYTSFIDEESAIKHNIKITNTPAVMAPAVAEQTIGFIIALQRKLFQQNYQIKTNQINITNSNELSACCVGIVGLGEIGSRVAKILKQGFNSNVVYYNRTRKFDLEREFGYEYLDIETLFSLADIIVLAIPTNPNTEYFVDDNLLQKTKSGVIIVNTAGARLIEPTALKKYINNNHIGAAAFDGYYIEPLPSVTNDQYQLLCLPDDKFVLTPHTAAKTNQSWHRMVSMAIDNVIDFFKKETVCV